MPYRLLCNDYVYSYFRACWRAGGVIGCGQGTVDIVSGAPGFAGQSLALDYALLPGFDYLSYWPLDEGSGTIVGDIISTNDGVVHGPDWIIGGKTENALVFDGDDDHISLGDTFDFAATDAFSISLWAKRDTKKGRLALFSRREKSGKKRGYSLSFANNGRLEFIMRDSSGKSIKVQSKKKFKAPGIWYHIVATYDGSSRASGVKFYVNGLDEVLKIKKDKLTGPIENNAEATIGGLNGPNDSFLGAIDEVAVVSGILTFDEIAGSTISTIPSASISPIGLSTKILAYWLPIWLAAMTA